MVSGGGGEASISFTATLVGSTPSIKEITKKIKIKGTSISTDLKLNAMPSVPLNQITFDPDPSKEGLKESSLEAGVRKTMANKISVKNNSPTISLDNVRVEIKADVGYEDKLDWIKFVIPSGEGNNITLIPTIPQKQLASLTFYLDPPKSALKDDAFYGTIIFSSPSIDSLVPVSVPVQFQVKTGFSKFALLTLMQPSNISVPCDDTLGDCAPKSSDQSFSLKNDGTEPLSDIRVEIDSNSSDADCTDWIDLKTALIPFLAADKKPITILMDIRPIYESANKFANCYLAWSYNDPVESKMVRIVALKPFKITKT
jgi:hypothetical protein